MLPGLETVAPLLINSGAVLVDTDVETVLAPSGLADTGRASGIPIRPRPLLAVSQQRVSCRLIEQQKSPPLTAEPYTRQSLRSISSIRFIKSRERINE